MSPTAVTATTPAGMTPREMAEQTMEDHDEFMINSFWKNRVCHQFEVNAAKIEERIKSCHPDELKVLQAEARVWRQAMEEPTLIKNAMVFAYMLQQRALDESEKQLSEIQDREEEDEDDDDY